MGNPNTDRGLIFELVLYSFNISNMKPKITAERQTLLAAMSISIEKVFLLFCFRIDINSKQSSLP